jgi:hypothetical protein
VEPAGFAHLLSSWTEKGRPLRLVQQSVAKDDPDPKAISPYGLYVPELDQTWLRFVDGRPVSGITTRFLGWCTEKLKAIGKKFLLLIWDPRAATQSNTLERWANHRRDNNMVRGDFANFTKPWQYNKHEFDAEEVSGSDPLSPTTLRVRRVSSN